MKALVIYSGTLLISLFPRFKYKLFNILSLAKAEKMNSAPWFPMQLCSIFNSKETRFVKTTNDEDIDSIPPLLILLYKKSNSKKLRFVSSFIAKDIDSDPFSRI